MKSRGISIIIIILVCTCCIGVVAGSSLAMFERAAYQGQDLVKKPSSDGSSGLKGAASNNMAVARVISSGPDSGLNARYQVLHRNNSVSGWKYPGPGTRVWPGSEVLTQSLGGTEIIQGTGTVRCIDSEGGTFGIIADDGTHYLPSSLPAKFKKDGLNVQFKAYKMPINPAYRMWGNPIRIISITAVSTKTASIETTGTVTWVPLEGGFWGIIADDGTQYDPLNLPEKYLQEGLRIRFAAVEEPDVVSFHMWGMFVTITEITPLDQVETQNGDVLVEYKRTGGIAGFNDHLTVFENGTTFVMTKNDEGRFVLSSKEMNDLGTLFESSGFNSLNQEDLAMFKVSGNDFFFYSIEFRGHTIEAIEYAFPESIDPVIERLNSLVLQGQAA